MVNDRNHIHQYGVLSAQTIREFSNDEDNPMVTSFNENNLRAASYDLTVGPHYYLYDKKHKGEVKISDLGSGDSLVIPPRGVCYVITEEKLKLPPNIAGSISLRLGLIRKGVMLASQPPIDPGYEGPIIAMLYNLSTKEVSLGRGHHVLSVEFRFLDQETDKPYDGNYANITLQAFIQEPIEGSLRWLDNKIENWKLKLSSFVPTILIVLTVIIAALTFIFGTIGVVNAFKKSPDPKKETVQQVKIQSVVDPNEPHIHTLEETKQDCVTSEESDE